MKIRVERFTGKGVYRDASASRRKAWSMQKELLGPTLARAFVLAVSLALTLAAARPAEAGLAAVAKCNVYRAKVELNFSKCLNQANLLEIKGRSSRHLACSEKYDTGMTRTREKFLRSFGPSGFPQESVTEAQCALEQIVTDRAKGLKLLAAGRNIEDFGLATSNLYDGLQVRELIDAAVAAAPGPESNDGLVCIDAGGQWDGEACHPALAEYDCAVGALCSLLASSRPDLLGAFRNDYVGEAPELGNAAACTTQAWNAALALVDPSGLGGLYDYPTLLRASGSYNACAR